jgi:hypothetical protein
MKKQILISVIFVLFSRAQASAVLYGQPELLARTNINDAYNLPLYTYIDGASPVINNQGVVTFKVIDVRSQGFQGLWVKSAGNKNGKIIYTSPVEKVVSDPHLNDRGQIVFSLFDDLGSDGIFSMDAQSIVPSLILKPGKPDLVYYSYASLLDNGHLVFRGTNKNDEHTFFDVSKQIVPILTVGTLNFGITATYLFEPRVNEAGLWVFKARILENQNGTQVETDKIVLLNPESSAEPLKIIADAQSLNAKSPFVGFGNTVSLSEMGHVVYTGLNPKGEKSLMVYKEGASFQIAKEGEQNISEIEQFAPKVNKKGLVAFRAKNLKGLRGIYVWSQAGLQRLLGEGDAVNTDLGPGVIISQKDFPGFDGNIDMNDHGEIVFHCIVVTCDGTHFIGSAVYKMSLEP